MKSFFLIAGPCVIEDPSETIDIAKELKRITDELNINFIFKASYKKANRTSHMSYEGPGLREGLVLLKYIKTEFGIRVTSDVHNITEVEQATDMLDIIQIPAFLCRQTDLIRAVARTGVPVNVKKGQFLAPWDMVHVVEKLKHFGCHSVWVTERGTTFGYNNLVVDFRSIPIMKEETKCPVVLDVTHSVQLPGGAGMTSGGQREFVPMLAKAGIAAGVDGIFMEVHPEPDKALCDGPNMVKLDEVENLLKELIRIKGTY